MSAYSNSMCKKIQFQGLSSSLRAEEETMLLHKQGVVTVLGSDCNRDRVAATISLRRTLSADMSSKKWLSKNALSSHDSLSSSEGEEEEMKAVEESEEAEQERFKIWCTIQRDKKEQKKKHDENLPSAPAPAPARFDTWSSILFDKAKEEPSNLVTPYIHPSLVKRSKSSLSEKSLEICTESLGSETGSDHVLSSNSKSSPSETEDDDKEQQQQQQQEQQHVMSVQVMQELEEEELLQQMPKHNYLSVKKSMPRCFPPPLPSLHMRSHRDGNGRLFLEAVHVAPQNNKFSAQRRDGRLVLTFASDEEEENEEEEGDEKDQVGELEEEFLGFEEDEEEYEEDENYDEGEEEEDEVVGDVEAVIEKSPLLSSGVITSNFHRLALKMNKPINGVVNRNTKWSEKFNEVINSEDDASVEEQHGGLVAQSLPPRPRVARLIPSATAALASTAAAAAASLNAYDCYWGTKHTPKVVASVPEPLHSDHQQNKYSLVKNNDRSSKLIVYGDVNLVVMRGKNGDYLVHNSKSCKDSRRPFLFWEPRCIAT